MTQLNQISQACKMMFYTVLAALIISASAWPYPEEQKTDLSQSALQYFRNAQMNDADPSAPPGDAEEYAEEQAPEPSGSPNSAEFQEYVEELVAQSASPDIAHEEKEVLQSQELESESELYFGLNFKQVYSLDMTNSGQRCPNGFRLNTYGSKRVCGRAADRSGCASIKVPVNGQRYTEVRGRVIGYQYASPDAFNTGCTKIDGVYVDGVSITYGSNPRKHVWTFAAGHNAYRNHPSTCPGTGYGKPQPAFVANNYFCSSGNFKPIHWGYKFYDVPLWSTMTGNCGQCNSRYRIPYFCTRLPQATNKDLEIRLCANQRLADEDVKIEAIELYIK